MEDFLSVGSSEEGLISSPQKINDFISSVSKKTTQNPETENKINHLSDDLSRPHQIVRDDLDGAISDAAMKRLKEMDITGKYPALATALSDEQFANVAHDDIDSLASFENLFSAANKWKATGLAKWIQDGYSSDPEVQAARKPIAEFISELPETLDKSYDEVSADIDVGWDIGAAEQRIAMAGAELSVNEGKSVEQERIISEG
jgi:hypothetical protein